MAERVINEIIVHCMDTPDDKSFGFLDVNKWHKERGFSPFSDWIFCGYHVVVRRNGTLEIARPDSVRGVHCAGHNSRTLGICWEGKDQMTDAQKKSMFTWIAQWCRLYKLGVENVKGHKEYDTAGKTCPNLDMDKFRAELKTFMGG